MGNSVTSNTSTRSSSNLNISDTGTLSSASNNNTDINSNSSSNSNSNNNNGSNNSSGSYRQLLNLIIRPPRASYTTSSLGPLNFSIAGRNFHRCDFDLQNSRNLTIKCSLWENADDEKETPCLIYLHGNSSCRLEALSLLPMVMRLGIKLLSFDFTGSGLSDGEYVSLGFYERDDLASVIEYLRQSNRVTTIGLWGRSMGAATALLHGERDPSIACMILDSSFSDLKVLVEDVVSKSRENGLFAPSFIISIGLRFVRSSILSIAKFDISDISPISHVNKCYIPALFIAAENDDFITPKHSQELYENYGGDKNIIIVDGDHNSSRPLFLFDSVSIFLESTLQVSLIVIPLYEGYLIIVFRFIKKVH